MKYITYLDKNNLYGYAMSKPLPMGEFKWLYPAKFNLDKYDDDSLRGCVLEVDLEYPKELHKWHNDYPLAPDKLEIKKEILSDYQLKIVAGYNLSIGNVRKLAPNFFDKEKHLLHYKNLQLYLRLGLKIKKVYCVLEFDLSKMAKTIHRI